MLPWKLRKRQILPVNQYLSSVYFSLAKFQLVSCNLFLAMIWQMTYTHKLPKLCSATLSHLWSLCPPTSLSGSFFLEKKLTLRDTKNWPRQTFQRWTPASVTLRVPSLLLLSVFTRLVPTPHYPARPVRLGSCGLSDACLSYVTEMHWSWRPGKKLYRDKAMSSHHRIFTWAINVNDLINARGVYLILEVQAGAFNR